MRGTRPKKDAPTEQHLSYHLRSKPTPSLKPPKVMLVSKQLLHLDRVAPIWQSLTSLLLSHNQLKDLRHISQFPGLKQLNLSHNELASPEVISQLKALVHLEQLCIEGNPVCSTLNFKALLVASIPSLKLLDGAAISARTLEQARLRVAKDQELLDTLLSNYSALITNHQLILKLKLKFDLMKSHPKCLQQMARQHREGDP